MVSSNIFVATIFTWKYFFYPESYFGIWCEAEVKVTFFHLFEYHLVNSPSFPRRFVVYQQQCRLDYVSVQAASLGVSPISSGAHLLRWIKHLRLSGALFLPQSLAYDCIMCYLETVLLFLSSAAVGFCMVIANTGIRSTGIFGEAGTTRLGCGWEPDMLSLSKC